MRTVKNLLDWVVYKLLAHNTTVFLLSAPVHRPRRAPWCPRYVTSRVDTVVATSSLLRPKYHPLISLAAHHVHCYMTTLLPTPPTLGADWDALDAVQLLHSDPHTPGRAGGAIASPPAFSATVTGDVNVQSNGEIRLAATQSAALTVIGPLTLAGGGLSGQGRIQVEGSTLIVASGVSSDGGVDVDEASSLKNGVTLDMFGGGVWSGGGLQARDGVSVVNRGQLFLSADRGTWFGHGKERQIRHLSKLCFCSGSAVVRETSSPRIWGVT